jgi:phenylpropionate dioxygenase-like ring-hydroxylating dioxygenase large terminal subunit
MRRETELALLDASIEIARSRAPFMNQPETLIPVAKYLDPARFAQEQALFRRSLNVASLSTQLASPGDFVTLTLSGTPLILVRGEDGIARAFVNVCRHRGARVELRDHGRCKTFVCPYHAWTYGTDGCLKSVRHRDGFPSLRDEDACLVALSCLEAAGLLWVCPDPQVSHPDFDAPTRQLIAELEGMLGPEPTAAATDVRDWQANWKLIVDGGIESYHFRIAHKQTIGRFFGDTDSHYAFIGEHIRSILPRRSMARIDRLPVEDRHLRDHANVLYSVVPNAMFLVQKSHVEMIVSEPLAMDRTRLTISTVGRAPGPDGYTAQARTFLEENHAFTLKTLAEDFELAEQIQAGMGTGVNTHFRLGRFEGALSEWHARLDARLA